MCYVKTGELLSSGSKSLALASQNAAYSTSLDHLGWWVSDVLATKLDQRHQLLDSLVDLCVSQFYQSSSFGHSCIIYQLLMFQFPPLAGKFPIRPYVSICLSLESAHSWDLTTSYFLVVCAILITNHNQLVSINQSHPDIQHQFNTPRSIRMSQVPHPPKSFGIPVASGRMRSRRNRSRGIRSKSWSGAWHRTAAWRNGKNKRNISGYGSIPINTIFRGMNIHLPAILMFTRGTR